MSHDVFLTCAEEDRAVAREIADGLSAREFSVFFEPQADGDRIAEAIKQARLVIVLFSSASNQSATLRKELAISDSLDKPVIPVRIEDAEPEGYFLYELTDRDWLDLYPDPVRKVDRLADAARQLLDDAASRRAAARRKPAAERGFILFGWRDGLWVFGALAFAFAFEVELPVEDPRFILSSLVHVTLLIAFPVFVWRIATRFVKGNRSIFTSLPAYLLTSVVSGLFAYAATDLFFLNLELTEEQEAGLVNPDALLIIFTLFPFVLALALHMILAVFRRLRRRREV